MSKALGQDASGRLIVLGAAVLDQAYVAAIISTQMKLKLFWEL
jgi:hypothetical protein